MSRRTVSPKALFTKSGSTSWEDITNEEQAAIAEPTRHHPNTHNETKTTAPPVLPIDTVIRMDPTDPPLALTTHKRKDANTTNQVVTDPPKTPSLQQTVQAMTMPSLHFGPVVAQSDPSPMTLPAPSSASLLYADSKSQIGLLEAEIKRLKATLDAITFKNGSTNQSECYLDPFLAGQPTSAAPLFVLASNGYASSNYGALPYDTTMPSNINNSNNNTTPAYSSASTSMLYHTQPLPWSAIPHSASHTVNLPITSPATVPIPSHTNSGIQGDASFRLQQPTKTFAGGNAKMMDFKEICTKHKKITHHMLCRYESLKACKARVWKYCWAKTRTNSAGTRSTLSQFEVRWVRSFCRILALCDQHVKIWDDHNRLLCQTLVFHKSFHLKFNNDPRPISQIGQPLILSETLAVAKSVLKHLLVDPHSRLFPEEETRQMIWSKGWAVYSGNGKKNERKPVGTLGELIHKLVVDTASLQSKEQQYALLNPQKPKT